MNAASLVLLMEKTPSMPVMVFDSIKAASTPAVTVLRHLGKVPGVESRLSGALSSLFAVGAFFIVRLRPMCATASTHAHPQGATRSRAPTTSPVAGTHPTSLCATGSPVRTAPCPAPTQPGG